MTTHYLVLNGIQAFEVHAHSGFYAMGMPGMTAFTGLMHALQLKCNELLSASAAPDTSLDSFDEEEKPTLAFTGIVPVVEKYEFQNSQLLRVVGLHERKGEANKPSPMGFDPMVNLGLSVIVAVETELLSSELTSLFQSRDFQAALCSCRLAGASLIWGRKAALHPSLHVALQQVNRSAFLLEDASDVLEEEMQAQGGHSVAAVGSLTARYLSGKGEGKPFRPRFIALGTGFRALESDLHKRPGTRDNAPHRYVEPLVGLVRVRLVSSVHRALLKGFEPKVLWNYAPPTPNGFYLVQGRISS